MHRTARNPLREANTKRGKWLVILLVVLLLLGVVPLANAAPKPKLLDSSDTSSYEVPELPTVKCKKFVVCISKDGSHIPQ
mgnify:CR=1 FL=1